MGFSDKQNLSADRSAKVNITGNKQLNKHIKKNKYHE